MGRLIDADALIKQLEQDKEVLQRGLGKDSKWAYRTSDSVIKLVNNQPTAYDVSKVVAELEEAKQKAQDEMEECIFKGLPYHDSTEGKVIGITTSIDIVRKGGVE